MPKPTYDTLVRKIRDLEKEIALVRRKEREKAIRELKWQWQATFDAVGASICVLDSHWNIVQCNRATLDLLGGQTDDIIGRKCFELVHGTTQPPEECPTRQLLITKKREVEVLTFRGKWIEVTVDPILDEEDNLKGIVHIINDITAHKAAAASIEKGESKLRSIFAAAPTGIGMVVNRIIVQANDRLCMMTGYSQAELLGQNARILYPTDAEYEFVGQKKYQQIAQIGTGTVETRWQRRDGEILNVLLSSTPLNREDLSEGVTFTALDITERKRIEEELSRIFTMSLDLICIADITTSTFTKVNPAFTEILGFSEAELLSRSFLDFIHPEDTQLTIDIVQKQLQQGHRVINFENRYRCKDGGYRWISWVSHPDPGGGVTYAVGRDITTRKRDEVALMLFNSAVEASSDAIEMSTPEGHHWYHNKAFDALFGNIGEDSPSTLYADQILGREILNTINTGKAWTGEVEMFARDGNRRDILLRAYAARDIKGKVISLVCVHTDITERKRYEGDLRRSEQRFRALAELLPQTVFEMDHNGLMTFINNNALKIFGFTREDFSQGLYALDMIAPVDRKRVQSKLDAILKGSENIEGRKFTAVRKNGKTFPVLVYTSTSIDEQGATGLRGIMIDISEQEKLSQEKDQLEEQYIQAQKMEAVGRLAGGVAHDLNNMLSPIVGYSELLLDAIPLDGPNRHAILQIFEAGQRAKDMVRQLLAFSRKQALDIRSVNLQQVLVGFEGLLDRILREDIKLELKLPNRAYHILADAGQIEQVVMNLAVNAQDAMPGGGKITIAVDVTDVDDEVFNQSEMAPGQYIVLIFSDTGHGMDYQTQENIFDPFFTTKGKGKGTGLGLATVYGIIKQHNGNIKVFSEPGQGTQFRIYFPAAQAPSKPASSKAAFLEHVGGSESILLVEDNDAVRSLADSVLKKHGYRTMPVSGGRECLDFLSQRPSIDLLLTDVVLEDTNGKELYYKVKSLYPEIKVIYMSGYTEDVIVHHGVLEEGISFIQKPFSIQELLKKVRGVLDNG